MRKTDKPARYERIGSVFFLLPFFPSYSISKFRITKNLQKDIDLKLSSGLIVITESILSRPLSELEEALPS